LIIIFKILLLFTLITIFFQDYRNRLVYWFLFPIVGILYSTLHLEKAGTFQFVVNSGINLTLIALMLLTLFVYARAILKRAFFETFGLGDLLLFVAISFSFSPATFLVLFVCSILFSILLYITLKNRSTHTTIPLAGNISLFFSVILVLDWLGCAPDLYLI